MDKQSFLQLPLKDQINCVISMAKNSLHILETYNVPNLISRRAVDLCDQYATGNFIPAALMGLYLNHPDGDYFDLSVQFNFVDKNPDARAALNLVIYATGVTGRKAYLDQNEQAMPEPIAMATPENAAFALDEYQKLLDKGLVAPVDF